MLMMQLKRQTSIDNKKAINQYLYWGDVKYKIQLQNN